jgi:hypothetical protein
MRAGDNPRFVVTSLEAVCPPMLYEDPYCARGNCANASKSVKWTFTGIGPWPHLPRQREAAGRACATSSLHHTLRTSTLQHTALAQAQLSTVTLTLFKITPQIQQCKDLLSSICSGACAPLSGHTWHGAWQLLTSWRHGHWRWIIMI